MTRLQQPPKSFDELADKAVSFDANQLSQVSQSLQNLAQMVDAVRAEARDADRSLWVGDRQVSPFADPQAGGEVNQLLNNTRSVYQNVQASLADLHQCLAQTATAMQRIAGSVHDNSQANQKRLRQLVDAAFNPQAARTAGAPTQSMPPLPTPRRRS